MALNQVFVSVIHGQTTDCRQANSALREKLMNYNFSSYITETDCFKCPNNVCNTSFLFILQKDEYFRLKNQVQACPETANAAVDACPPSKVTYVQTDFMVGKKDSGIQTEELESADMSCQVDLEPDRTMALVPCLATVSAAEPPITSVAGFNSSILPDNRVVQSTVARGNSELQQRIPVIINQVIQKPPSVENQNGNELITSTDLSGESNQGSPIRSLEVQQDDESADVVFIEIRRPTTIIPTIREVKIEEPEEIEQSQPEKVVIREVKQEPVEEPVTKEHMETEQSGNSVDDILSTTLSSANFITPKRITSGETLFEVSAKRMKFSEIEICDKCMAVTEFSSLKDYCAHVLEVHITLLRFKCKVCPVRCFDSNRAIHHAQQHLSETEGDNLTFEELIEKNIPEENFARFIRVANQCYPEKFRNIPTDQLIEIIHSLP